MPVELPQLETSRLILRQWRDSDAKALAAMNADLEVMRYFPKPLDRAASDAMLGRVREKWRLNGYSFSALEVKGGGFIGFAGLNLSAFPPIWRPVSRSVGGWRVMPGGRAMRPRQRGPVCVTGLVRWVWKKLSPSRSGPTCDLAR